MRTELRLWRRPGWGSAIVEAQLALYRLEAELVDPGDLRQPQALAALQRVNPLGQIPTLELGDGRVLTESAAMTLWLAERTGSELLVPGPQADERAAFLNGLIFVVANIYPTFTYGDVPERFAGAAGAATIVERTDAYRLRLLRQLAAGAGEWLLGARFSALDLYVAVMVQWRPGRDWFRTDLPALAAIADRVWARPELAAVRAANFG